MEETILDNSATLAKCALLARNDVRRLREHFAGTIAAAIKGLGAIDAHIRRRIRAIIVRQKKRSRFLLRHLKAKGVSPKAAASCAYCGKGAWVKSNRPAMTRAYPPSWFTGRMASLTALWNEINQPQVSTQLSLAF